MANFAKVFLKARFDAAVALTELYRALEPQDTKKTPLSSGYTSKVKVSDRYKVVGFISSGTYGRVYKAVGHNGQSGEFAIKKYTHCLCRYR